MNITFLSITTSPILFLDARYKCVSLAMTIFTKKFFHSFNRPNINPVDRGRIFFFYKNQQLQEMKLKQKDM